jgi:ABC-type dipeptide/oligopeptide/nickel transport system permease component
MLAYVARRILIMPFLLPGVAVLLFGMISLLTPDERPALYRREVPRKAAQAETLIRASSLCACV